MWKEIVKKILLGKNWWGVLFHFFLIVIVSYLLINYFFNSYLPSFTNHGVEIKVPTLEKLSIDEAEAKLEKIGLRCKPVDTIYNANYKSLEIIKHVPHAGDMVKSNRMIYLTINAPAPPSVIIDSVILKKIELRDVKACRSSIKNLLGIKDENILIQEVDGPYDGFVRNVLVGDREITVGDSYDVETIVTLMVDSGFGIDSTLVTKDSLELSQDSLENILFENNDDADVLLLDLGDDEG